ncbi:hypothetical protein CR513_57651, partial [Mucuna pruriens]
MKLCFLLERDRRTKRWRQTVVDSGDRRRRWQATAYDGGGWQQKVAGSNTPDDDPQLWAQVELCSALIPIIIHYTSTGNVPRPLEIQIPTPFPYTNSQVVPWRYASGIEQTSSGEINIVGVGGITRSGQIYTLEDIRREDTLVQGSPSIAKKARVTEKESEIDKKEEHAKFLKFISQIRRNSWHIMANNYITFSDEEISAEGRGHNRALNILGVLINVLPKAMLERLPYDKNKLRNISTKVRAFDGSQREVVGEIEIPV